MMIHVGPSVYTVKESDNQELVEKVEEVHTHILFIRERMMKHGFILANHDNFEDYISNLGTCERLKSCEQQLIDKVPLKLGA